MSDKSNPRALWMACGRGDVEVATAQLNSGDKINAREPNSQGTALYFASLNGHLEVVQLLLKKSADANIPNKSGQTPLHVAQTPEVAGALLDAGCDEYATNKLGKTAEQYTAMLGRVNIRELEGRQVVADKIAQVLDARHEAEWHAAQASGGE